MVLAFAILAGVVSVGMGAMSNDERQRAEHNCLENNDKSACQAVINHFIEEGLGLENCIREDCRVIGRFYYYAGRYREAIPYYEKAIALGNGAAYYSLGVLYETGRGVRQDYHKAVELYKKACDMGYGFACNDLGVLYGDGLGVRQNLSTAKQYYGKACDLGEQKGCDNYKLLNSQGVR